MIRKINGKGKTLNVGHLNKPNRNIASTKEDISNTLAETFSKNSSSSNYDERFQTIKSKEENKPLNYF